MPHAAIHRLHNALPNDRKAVVEAVNRAMVNALKVPDDSHPVRLQEYPAEAFLIPAASSDAFTLVEATIFSGRTLETKRALYRAIIEEFGAIGIAATDVRVVLYEVPRENWGLKGGVPASEIDLGFEVEI
jgi:phenylpyruvate tautomerase PptA (4-oxalocrotonate tautomerase family)